MTPEREGTPLPPHVILGRASLLAGRTVTALVEFEAAARAARTPAESRLAAHHEALVHAVRGSLDAADGILAHTYDDDPARDSSSGGGAEPTDAVARAARALLAVERLTPEATAAVRDLDAGSPELLPFALLADTRLSLAEGLPHRTLDTLDLLLPQLPARGPLVGDIATASRIDALALLGDLRAAGRIDAAGGDLTRLARARLVLRHGRPAAAATIAGAILAARGTPPGQRAEASLLIAWATFLRTGRVDAALATSAARWMLATGARRPLAMLPASARAELAAAVPADVGDAFVRAAHGVVSAPEAPRIPPLTRSERRVLAAVRGPVTLDGAAHLLGVSRNTVKTHLTSVYRKLGVTRRAEALVAGERLGLFDGIESMP